jgi:hypothetical protein
MELRARTPAPLRRAGLLVALPALLVPAVAGTTTAQAKTHAPVVTRITPKHVFVGETLTIRGHHFRRGLNKNTVAFKRSGAKVVFVQAAKGTTKLLKVKLPKRLEKVLVVKNGTPVPTRLRVRVLSSRFGKRFTSDAMSPIVGPEKPPAPPAPPVVDPNADCDGDGAINRVDADDDNDLLSDSLETSLKLDPCSVDTDGDGVEDGYEYQSARDLNDDEHQTPNQYLPYPAKRPYPNALDGTDAKTDHDGDSLTLKEEYLLWKYTVKNGAPRSLSGLTYSAGEKFTLSTRAGGTGNRTPTQPAAGYGKQASFLAWASSAGYATVQLANIGTSLGDPQASWWAPRTSFDIRDANRDGILSNDERYYFDFGSGHRDGMLDDAERDEDADGLSNFAETRGCMNRALWDGLFKNETRYPLSYAGTDLDDADTDGDGVRDGADDQDHDDVPNIMECNRLLAAGIDTTPADGILDEDPHDASTPRAGLTASGFVNPFNPCLPHRASRTCRPYLEGTPWAPFNPQDKYYFIWD